MATVIRNKAHGWRIKKLKRPTAWYQVRLWQKTQFALAHAGDNNTQAEADHHVLTGRAAFCAALRTENTDHHAALAETDQTRIG